MKTLAGSARFLAKLALLALAVVVATLAPAQDSRRVGADHSELYIALSAASSNHMNSLFFVVGSEARTFYVRAKDVHDPTGVAGFELTFVYDNDVVSVQFLDPDSTWLNSTGRSVLCSASTIRAITGDPDGLWEALVGCGTLGAEGLGPQGSGLLGSITLKPALVPGSTALTNRSSLVDTTEFSAEIPVTVRSSNVTVAYCGDLNGDGAVTVSDIGIMIANFGRAEGGPDWNPDADLNGDGVITVSDIGLVVVQFGTLCTR